MKNHIIRLIKDDIKITTLILSLEILNISAPDHYLGNSTIIFDLMQIPNTLIRGNQKSKLTRINIIDTSKNTKKSSIRADRNE